MSQQDEFQDMINKLPNFKLEDLNTVLLDELDYKLLYCVKNNNQNSDEAKSAYNYLIDQYDINEKNIDGIESKRLYNNLNITFEEGFFVIMPNAKKGGSSAIPTQKRRPNRKRKSSHTIKDRAKTR